MTDPQVPVERGLRATVRMAAGINIGDTADDETVFTRLARLLKGLALPRLVLPRLEGRFDGLLSRLDPLTDRALLRPAGLGAGAGALLVACGFAALAGHAALQVPEKPVEVALHVEEAAAKTDRLATAKVAAIAAPTASDATDITITTRGPAESTTLAMPLLAFASADLRTETGIAAIDRVLDAPPIAAIEPAAVHPEEEEDDEQVVPLALPMPRARPAYELSHVLPLPKPRPRYAALTPPGVAGPDGAKGEDDVPLVPASAPVPPPVEPRSSSNVLGFFSTPAEPMKPPSKMKVDTPFGVPYVLQTGSVETACLKPDLVDVLRRIEGHYHQKVVITSGFRDRGRQGSLHRQCAAVDIQLNGVGAADLAAFARSIPGIGGVGTYCHPNMIHVDIGTPRDWKYGCGSFFAMRGAPGKWGKVPGNLAKAKTGAPPSQTATDAQEEE